MGAFFVCDFKTQARYFLSNYLKPAFSGFFFNSEACFFYPHIRISERIYSIFLDTVVAIVFESLVKLKFEGVEPKDDN